jgi:hypothetical protein
MAYTTIKKPSDYFNTILYTGDGTAGQSQTGVGFEPDMVWVKSRNATNYHGIADQVRGVGKFIYPNDTTAEQTNLTDYLTSFDSDGFTHGLNGTIGQNSVNYAAWNWLANNTSGSSNTDGSTTSTVSANTTSGFSIVQWTGTSGNTTIGHGLGTVPAMVIAKNLGGSTNWVVWHKSLTSGYYLKLNLTNAQDNANSYFTADPTNSILSLTGNTAFNQSGNGMIAYCFADKQGYSKFGSYTGNGNTDGTFVYTGFKPAFVMFKDTTSAGDWTIQDSARDTFNLADARLYANLNNSENDGSLGVDFLSNGIKIRTSSAGWNTSGNTYIYMAFAEEPLVGDNPATAR